MREKLNSSPAAQIALIGILAVGVGFLLLSGMGGGSEAAPTEEAASTGETTATATTAEGEAEAGASAVSSEGIPTR